MEHPLAVRTVIEQQAVHNRQELLQLQVLLLVEEVVFVLRAELSRVRHFVGLEFLGVNVPLTVLEDVQDYGLLAPPHDWFSLFRDVVDFIQ